MNRVPRRVIVYYHRGLRTGGPEALHQLVATLRAIGTDAYLTPIIGTESNPRSSEYGNYDAPEIDHVVDAEDIAVVVPESYPEGLKRFRKAQRFCWWLSIDNSPAFSWQRHPTLSVGLGKYRRRLHASRLIRDMRAMERSGLHHLVQSHYAWAFLNSQLGIVSSMVSDYTVFGSSETPSRTFGLTGRKPVVAYNPAKGGKFVTRLQEGGELEIDWLPIVQMTPSEVATALRKSDVYVDLGHHPGKDRLPREAAIAGALTLVARRGSGAYAADVPIPLQHKIPVEGDIATNAAAAITRVLPRLQTEIPRQEFYRDVIRAERETFTRQVRTVFQAGVLGLDLDIPGVKLPDTA